MSENNELEHAFENAVIEENKRLVEENKRLSKELAAERRNETTIARRERDIHARVLIGMLYHEQTELWKALEVMSATQKRIKDALNAIGDKTDNLYDFFTKQIDKVYEDEEEKGASNE